MVLRSYHLPGHSWCEDWAQYFRNNHPLLGICCHYPGHPLGVKQRLVWLVASISFGLTVTNMIYIWFHASENYDVDEPAIILGLDTANVTGSSVLDDTHEQVVITQGMLMLWTVGTSAHSMFDLTIWYISACACCQTGGGLERLKPCARFGHYIVIVITVLVVAFASFIVVLRVSVESEQALLEQTLGNVTGDVRTAFGVTDVVGNLRIQSLDEFEFLVGYGVELTLAYFLFYPLLGTILFSGVLGCGQLPLLGGRPREVALERAKKNRERKSRMRTMDTYTSCDTDIV